MKTQRVEATDEERPFMLGIRWMSFGGRSGWFHSWSDGTVLPVLTGRDEDDNSGDDDNDSGDDDDNTDDEDDDDSDDDSDDDDGDKPKGKESKRVKELSDENAKWRNKHKARLQERDAAITRAEAAEAKVAKLEKDGGGDETLKARVTELETEVKTLRGERDELQGKVQKAAVQSQVAEAMEKLGIADDVKYVMYVLNDNNQLKVDDDGDIEDLIPVLKKHLKSKTFDKVSSGDEADDSSADGDGSGAPRRTRSKSSKRKVSSQGLDRATLEAKYPALRR